MALADRIKECRTHAGLSQSEVATKLCVSRQAVTKWESGKGTPDIENLTSLARLFGVSVDHLLDGEGTRGEVVRRESIDVASLEPYRPRGKLMGSKAHAAVKGLHPSATIWPLVRTQKNTRSQETMEWLGSLFFNTPFNVFSGADALSNRDSYYLVENGPRQVLARVGADSVEERELSERVSGKRFDLGQDRFRRMPRPL